VLGAGMWLGKLILSCRASPPPSNVNPIVDLYPLPLSIPCTAFKGWVWGGECRRFTAEMGQTK